MLNGELHAHVQIPVSYIILDWIFGSEVKTLDPEKELLIWSNNFGSGVKTLDPKK